MDNLKNDIYYIRQVLGGNTSAFTFLVEEHKNNVYNISFKILQNKEEAEEIAQDTFLKAFQKLNTFKFEAKFSTWLYRIAYNFSISQLRKRKNYQVEIDDKITANYSEDELIESIFQINNLEREKQLKEAVTKLKGEEQLLLQLYYEKEHSTTEIAEILQIKSNNVKIKLHRTRQKLFAILSPLLNFNPKLQS